MLAFITGTVEYMDESQLILNHDGIGFAITVPANIQNSVEAGDEVRLYTHMSVREDDISLYGFISRDELRIFRLLLSVSGIGPKAAVGILSALSPDELTFAVLGDDVKTICKAPGIGKKTAQKMILELKDKLHIEDVMNHTPESPDTKAAQNTSAQSIAAEDAVQALMALGYSSSESLRAVKSVKPTDEMTTDAILKAALKYLF